MNEHDSETMSGLLEQMGYRKTDDRQMADIILLNTCAIRENAEDKVFGELGHLKTLKLERPGLLLGVCGCMSQEETVVNRIMQKHPFVDLVFGTHNIHRLPYLVRDALFNKEMVIEVWSKEGDIIENLPKKREDARLGEHHVWLRQVLHLLYRALYARQGAEPPSGGCHRGSARAGAARLQRDYSARANVNAYGKDFTERKYTFGDLMDDIHKIDIPRIRFTTSHPRDFDDRLVEVLAKRGNLVEHIHLPVQSGSSEVLKR